MEFDSEEEYNAVMKMRGLYHRDKAAEHEQAAASAVVRKVLASRPSIVQPVASYMPRPNFVIPRSAKSSNSMTGVMVRKANRMFSQGYSRAQVARSLGIPSQNLTHWINKGAIKCRRS